MRFGTFIYVASISLPFVLYFAANFALPLDDLYPIRRGRLYKSKAARFLLSKSNNIDVFDLEAKQNYANFQDAQIDGPSKRAPKFSLCL